MSEWLAYLAAAAGLPQAKLALGARYGLPPLEALKFLQAAADLQSADAAWELSKLDSPELFEVAVQRGSPSAFLEKLRRGQHICEQLPDKWFHNQSVHDELLPILQTFTADRTAAFYALCLSEAKYWQPISSQKAFECYLLFEASGQTDFSLLRRILLSQTDQSLHLDFIKRGDCYVSGDLGFTPDPDLAYVNYRNGLLGFPAASAETERIIETAIRPLLIEATLNKVNECTLEFTGLLLDDRFPIIRGSPADESGNLFMILGEEDAAGYYRAVLEDLAEELHGEAQYQIARSTEDAIERDQLMTSAAAKNHEHAQEYLLSQMSDLNEAMLPQWAKTSRCPAAVFVRGCLEFVRGNRAEAERLWWTVPVDIYRPFEKLLRNRPDVILAFCWMRAVDHGNAFEARAGKLAFVAVLVAQAMDEVNDWPLVVSLLEQVVLSPAFAAVWFFGDVLNWIVLALETQRPRIGRVVYCQHDWDDDDPELMGPRMILAKIIKQKLSDAS
jgi:hypothetical protein